MKNISYFAVAAMVVTVCNIPQCSAQRVGVNVTQPASTVDIKGSFALPYNTDGAGGLLSLDSTGYFLRSYKTGSNLVNSSVVFLPQAKSGGQNFKGRIYSVKNANAEEGAGLVTVQADNGINEKIDNSANVDVDGATAISIISTGLTTGNTWTIGAVLPTKIQNTTQVFSITDNNVQILNPGDFNAGIPQILEFQRSGIIVNAGNIGTYVASSDFFQVTNAGIYLLEGYACYNNVGGNPTTIGVDLAFSINGSGTLVGVARYNFTGDQLDLNNGMITKTVVSLAAGDRIRLVMYREGGGDNSPDPEVHPPIGIPETKRLTITKL